MVGSKKVVKGSSVTTLIARNTKVEGRLEFSGVLEVEGVVVGDIVAASDSKSVVRILHNGRVEGEIRVPQIIINGEVVGDVLADEQLYLAEKAMIEGNVHYRVIEIEKGARINGSILQMGKESDRPATTEDKPADSSLGMQGDTKLANT